MPLDGRKPAPAANPAAWSTTPQFDSVDTEILLVRQYAQGLNGPLTLYADPVGPLDAVTLEYLNATVSGYAQLTTGLNPPVNPVPGQLWWDPAVAQLFIWYEDPNSNQWVIANNTGIQEAPVGTTLYGPVVYGRSNRTWVPVLALSGGIMTGSLVLAADPTVPLEAATKGYVDGTLQNAMLGYLPLSGGTMLGPLVLNADPTGALQAATKEYVDANTSVALVADAPLPNPIQGRLWFDSVSALLFIWYDDGESAQWVQVNTPGGEGGPGGIPGGIFLPLIGGTLTGDLILADSPTATSPALQAATKAYVDSYAGSAYLPIAGGTLTGPLTIDTDPVAQITAQGATTAILSLNGGANTGIQFQSGTAGEWAITADYGNVNPGLHITRFSQSAISIDPISLKITGGYFSTTAGDPVLADDLARKAYVDSLFASSTFFIGAVNASTGFVTYTAASGFTNGPLVDATLVNPGSYLICTVTGNAIPAGNMEVGDWLISDGTTWNVLHLGQAEIMASSVGVTPEINGADNVQDALQSLTIPPTAGEIALVPPVAGITDVQTAITNLTASQLTQQVADTRYLQLSGANAMLGQLNMGLFKVVQMADPSVSSDAATKNYVDTLIAALPPVVGPWQPLTPVTNWVANNLRCRWIFGPTVSIEIEGRVNSPTAYTGSFTNVTTLPVGYRPTAANIQYLISCYSNTGANYGAARLVIAANSGLVSVQPVMPMTGSIDFYISGIMAPLN